MHHKHEIFFSSVLIWLVFAITVLDILNQLFSYFLQERYFSLLINTCSWIMFVVVIFWILEKPKKYSVLLFLVLVTAIKFVYLALFFRQFQFQKGIILLPILISLLYDNQRLRVRAFNAIFKWRYPLFVLVLMTVIPFLDIGRYISGDYRFYAIWSLPQSIAYYLVAFMFIVAEYNLFVVAVLFIIVAITGVRSALLPAFIYVVYTFIVALRSGFSTARKIALSTVIGIALLLAVLLNPNFKFLRSGVAYNIRPIFEENITDPGYGKGRVGLNVILFEEFRNFSALEMLIGRSASSMYDYYLRAVGTRTWPHNDFMTILYAYGIVGLLVYIYYLFIFPLKYFKKRKLAEIIVLEVTVFIFALTNGFYTYFSSFLFAFIYGITYEQYRRTCSNA